MKYNKVNTFAISLFTLNKPYREGFLKDITYFLKDIDMINVILHHVGEKKEKNE